MTDLPKYLFEPKPPAHSERSTELNGISKKSSNQDELAKGY